MRNDVVDLLPARRGHFVLESGHHGDLWLDLERLCLRPEPVRRLAGELAARLARHQIEAVCGPLVEGAFVALLVAADLHIPFTYSEPFTETGSEALYPIGYRIPPPLRAELAGKRVAIVNDVVNAGSAVRGTFADLQRCDAHPVAIASLAILGRWAADFAADQRVECEALVSLPNQIWPPADCPLCARGVPLTHPRAG